MKFANLNHKLERMDYSRLRRPKASKKFMVRALVVLTLLAVATYLPVRGAYNSSREVLVNAREVQEAAKNNNLDEIKKNLIEMKEATHSLNSSLGWLFWVRVIPIVGSYYSDAKKFGAAGEYELTAAEKIAETLEPHKSELGFNGQATPGQDKIAQFVKILDIINPKIAEIEPELKSAREEVAGIDVNKYPEKIGGRSLRSRVDTAKNFIIGAHIAVTEAKDALDVAPSALGSPSSKTYLLLFQNDKEIRPTGGFITAFATLNLNQGRLSTTQSDDIYRLDEKLLAACVSKICPLTPPEPIVKYLPEVTGKPRTAWSMRDSNISPDVPTSMGEFERMYQLLGQGLPFDGIILIDSQVVEDLIKITGPVEVFGTTFSADTDKRCNCPNVIYELENYAQIIERGEQDRKAVLGTLMQQILARSLGSATDKLPEFINVGVKLANSKHVIFYMHDDKTQQALSKLNWTGSIKDFDGDYLHINDANFAGGKSNLYVTQKVELNLNVSNQSRNQLTIEYSNPQKYDRWLNGINRDYVRIYVPKGAKLISSKGSEVNVTTKEDEVLNKTYFEAFIQVRPQNSTRLEFEWELPENYGQDGQYPILIQRQPGAKDFEYTVKIDGKLKEKFNLNSDKELKLEI